VPRLYSKISEADKRSVEMQTCRLAVADVCRALSDLPGPQSPALPVLGAFLDLKVEPCSTRPLVNPTRPLQELGAMKLKAWEKGDTYLLDW
jgi:hypothetical protein